MVNLINTNPQTNLIQSNLNKQVLEDSCQSYPSGKAGNKKKKFDKNKAGAFIGSAAGIAAGVACVYAHAKKGNPALKFKELIYEEKDVLIVGAGSVIGGLAGGTAVDDDRKNNFKYKLREASQQFFGCFAAPLGLLALGNRILDKNNITKTMPKAAVTLAAIFGGMELGNTVMNKVNNKIFNEKVKHEVHPSDYLLHLDDLCLAAGMLFKDVKSLSAVTSKIIPASLILAGAKTGSASKQNDGCMDIEC